MKKRIAFFTVGFAFNRLVRMRFYEKIFPRGVELFLLTTDKYRGKEKEKMQEEYKLRRTKIIKFHYNPLTLPFEIRKFCKQNNIDRIFNLGFHLGAIALVPAVIFSKTDLMLNILVDIFNQHRRVETKKEALFDILTLALLFPLVKLSKRVMFTDQLNFFQAPNFFLSSKKKMRYLAAPVNTQLFKRKNRNVARRKLKIPLNKKVIIYIGRVNYLRGSDVLKYLIENNPDIHFYIFGPIIDRRIFSLKCKNYIQSDKISPERLADYYAASDFAFCLNRGGAGIGLASAEALACGIPIIVSDQFRLKKSPALYQIPVDSKKADAVIKNYFKLSDKEKKKISIEATKYSSKYYSDIAWKSRYIEAYLN